MVDHTHAFVIRLWNEASGSGIDSNTAAWRGYIDHVSTGTRLHLNGLDEILPFIALQLQTLQPRPDSNEDEPGRAIEA